MVDFFLPRHYSENAVKKALDQVRPIPHLLLASKWQKISKLIVYFCVVHSFEKEDFLENSCILSCFVQLISILLNLACVFDLFTNVFLVLLQLLHIIPLVFTCLFVAIVYKLLLFFPFCRW